MHRDLIRQLDEAVTEVFAVMLNLVCTSEPARANSKEEQTEAGRAEPHQYLTASVLFSGPLEGRCCLQLEERTATELTSNLMGMPLREISPDLCADTTGELCNMIAGSWKKRHPTDLAASFLSCPTVTIGSCDRVVDTFREATTLLYHVNGHHLTLLLAFD